MTISELITRLEAKRVDCGGDARVEFVDPNGNTCGVEFYADEMDNAEFVLTLLLIERE